VAQPWSLLVDDTKIDTWSVLSGTVTWPTTLSDNDIYMIQQNMYSSFIKNDIDNIFIYHIIGDTQGSIIARNNLDTRLQRIAWLVNITKTKEGNSIQDLAAMLALIEKKLLMYDKHAPIPTNVLSNIRAMKNWLWIIKKYPFGIYKESGVISTNNETKHKALEELYILAKLRPWRLLQFR
jgi:hypothetical protein